MKDMMVFGIRPIQEALSANKSIDKVLIQNNLRGDNYQQLLAQLRKKNVKIQYVPIEKLHKLTPKNHQGIIAFISPFELVPLD